MLLYKKVELGLFQAEEMHTKQLSEKNNQKKQKAKFVQKVHQSTFRAQEGQKVHDSIFSNNISLFMDMWKNNMHYSESRDNTYIIQIQI